jgi:hypothetical protein
MLQQLQRRCRAMPPARGRQAPRRQTHLPRATLGTSESPRQPQETEEPSARLLRLDGCCRPAIASRLPTARMGGRQVETARLVRRGVARLARRAAGGGPGRGWRSA